MSARTSADGATGREGSAVGEVRLARLAANHITDILGPLQKALDIAFMRKVLCSVQIFEA